MTNTDSDNSKEWAAQAYALLKKRQEDQKQELKNQEEQNQELKKQELIDSSSKESVSIPPQTIAESEFIINTF